MTYWHPRSEVRTIFSLFNTLSRADENPLNFSSLSPPYIKSEETRLRRIVNTQNRLLLFTSCRNGSLQSQCTVHTVSTFCTRCWQSVYKGRGKRKGHFRSKFQSILRLSFSRAEKLRPGRENTEVVRAHDVTDETSKTPSEIALYRNG